MHGNRWPRDFLFAVDSTYCVYFATRWYFVATWHESRFHPRQLTQVLNAYHRYIYVMATSAGDYRAKNGLLEPLYKSMINFFFKRRNVKIFNHPNC